MNRRSCALLEALYLLQFWSCVWFGLQFLTFSQVGIASIKGEIHLVPWPKGPNRFSTFSKRWPM